MKLATIAMLLLSVSLFADATTKTFTPTLPDLEVTTHEGKKVRFYSDLVKDKVVAVNFVFTNCSTICPASGALFASLQKQHERVHFISISIDPTVDTPKKLAAWSQQFRKNASWTLVTGSQANIDRIVKAFGASTARPQDHVPLTIVGSDVTRLWSRLYGFPGNEQLTKLVDEISAPRKASAAHNYFTDVVLTDQHGKEVRLYSDLLAGRTVVINSFFATCSGSCPVMTGTFRRIQSTLGDRVHLISISVDPETDTPAQLRRFAKEAGAEPNWHFITGDKTRVAAALHKLGLKTDLKENHSAVVLIGNEPKGVWKKAFGLAKSDDVMQLVQEVVAAQ
ncbi:MAG TPA: SCO family protein [Thermoanaerobaculia bacterium]|jgi:cytochrome oxidase Cu insertion factor (SCO1/SenC/PrrC family)